jgi:hypothetical protein
VLTYSYHICPEHLEWLLERGKKLERACEFATALKYYFAGKMYFARYTALFPSRERVLQKLAAEFDRLYADLLPMTNAQVIDKVSTININ